ncbi:hypothetical protein LPJ58_001043 [Coemansia sp. RSA 1591]|nr:hypothetical protein LPJ58_001043 [Coemansia sp. RSA 1591]KAJ2429661.1 hypothetical protein GGF47_000549 [Coemansia sp. RSA 2524]KAJ2442850.1 hypothetical protein IWW46_002820 [Coemansia sp. RSA 2440]
MGERKISPMRGKSVVKDEFNKVAKLNRPSDRNYKTKMPNFRKQAKLTGGIRKVTLAGDAEHRLKDGKNADGILRIDWCSAKQLNEVRDAVVAANDVATVDPGRRVLFQFLSVDSTPADPKTMRVTGAELRHHTRLTYRQQKISSTKKLVTGRVASDFYLPTNADDAESGVNVVADQEISAQEAETILQKVGAYIKKNKVQMTEIYTTFLREDAEVAVEPILEFFYKHFKSDLAMVPLLLKLRFMSDRLRQQFYAQFANRLREFLGGPSVLFLGDYTPVNKKFQKPTPGRSSHQRFLREDFNIVLLNECNTSQQCPSCLGKVEKWTDTAINHKSLPFKRLQILKARLRRIKNPKPTPSQVKYQESNPGQPKRKRYSPKQRDSLVSKIESQIAAVMVELKDAPTHKPLGILCCKNKKCTVNDEPRFWARDVMSTMNMRLIIIHILLFGSRPALFSLGGECHSVTGGKNPIDMVEKLNVVIRGIEREMDSHSEDSGQAPPPKLLDHVKELLGMKTGRRMTAFKKLVKKYSASD